MSETKITKGSHYSGEFRSMVMTRVAEEMVKGNFNYKDVVLKEFSEYGLKHGTLTKWCHRYHEFLNKSTGELRENLFNMFTAKLCKYIQILEDKGDIKGAADIIEQASKMLTIGDKKENLVLNQVFKVEYDVKPEDVEYEVLNENN